MNINLNYSPVTLADFLEALDALEARGIAHFATLYQPIVSFLCGVVGIISGIMAIRHYYLKSKHHGKG
jgi:hypothetical protein